MATLAPGASTRTRRSRGRTLWGALAATAMVSAMLVVGSAQSGAATTKNINATCTGADEASRGLLAAIDPSGSLTAPLTAVVDAPPFVEPGQTGVPVAVTWSLNLSADLSNTAIGLGVSSMDVKNAIVDVAVSGPTDTTTIPGRPANQTIALVANQPLSSSFGPFNATLDNIGGSGVIKFRSEQFLFDIGLSVAGTPTELKIQCATSVTLATVPIKIAGSPDIVQPIEVASVPGQSSTIDVLSEFVTNGRTKAGEEQQVDTSTLRIVEGDAAIVDGKVEANAPAAGQSSDVTFEVCAGTIQVAEEEPGISEVQELRFFYDPSAKLFDRSIRRQMGVRFSQSGEEATKTIWSLDFNAFFPEPTPPADESRPEDAGPAWASWWQGQANALAVLPHSYPTAAEVQAGLESIPGIGAGNISVTRGDIVSNGVGNVPEGETLKGPLQYRPYIVEFTGALAAQSIDQILTARLYSLLPTEIRDGLLALADGLGGGGEGDGEGEGEEPTPIPDGLTPTEYINQLNYQAAIKIQSFNFAGAAADIELMFKVLGENVGALIDIGAVTALLGDMFIPAPGVSTTVNGEDPVEAQFQELCSQGVITLTSASVEAASVTATGASVEGTTATNTSANSGGASLSPAG